MSVGTMSINGVQVATVESFKFTPIVDEASVDLPPPIQTPQVIRLPFSISFVAPTHVRHAPKGRWVGGVKDAPDVRVYVVSGRRVGLVRGSSAAMAPLGGSVISYKQGRRRCESKRWVERTYAEAWYREEMWRQRLAAMGFRVVTVKEAGGQNG